ncbi:uncharacterized protein EV420DRAFT_941284 [Desarmillaria tabescens]|uniref:Uncharacterized protein n=1 Tax=Armillaria tabescens TaxID=1929756 RepID=A0AA39NGE5_ARMTA|nr:uncharacterized protein EV420DRAFT_941284 [Desarmillaria tabescens]KAK0465140.1 hypothetical protein EV420DRAFT_941284 [Desarmillaria tabescens]
MRTPAIYALYICLPFALHISAERHSARGLKNQQLTPAVEQSSLSDRALSSSTYVPSSSTYDVSDGQTVEFLYQRRVDSIISHLTGAEDIAEWLSTLNYSTGQWPDINYATGCAAQRANWPAGVHWQRLLVMAGAWHGGLSNAEQYVQQEDILHAISIGMDW